MIRARSALILFTLALAVAATSLHSARAATPSPSPSASPVAGIANSAALRDELVTLALGNLSALAAPGFVGVFPAWQAAHPELTFSGSAIAATPSSVSIRYNYLLDKVTPSATNPNAVTFAVLDTLGHCTLGAVYGFPKISQGWSSTTLNAGVPCTSATAAEMLAGVLAAATPSASATTATTPTLAPLPPATGSGAAAPAQGTLLGWAVFGALLLAASLGSATALQRRANRRSR